MKNYYEVLGLEKKATQDEIKAAYRKLAKEFHPDRNPGDAAAATKFKEVQEAYDVVGDVKKKSVYDNPFVPPPKPGTNILETVEITLDSVVETHTREVIYKQDCICENCNGMGGSFQKCDYCNGAGFYINPSFSNLHITVNCNQCRGSGVSTQDICTTCRGSGYHGQQDKQVTIKIPKGIENNVKLSFRNEGNPGRNRGKSGHLLVLIKIKKHEFFTPTGNGEILCTVPITIQQAALGDEIDVPTLHKKIIVLKIPIGIQSGTKLKITKLGLPVEPNSNIMGDMLVELKVETPVHLTDKFIEELERTSKFNEDKNYPLQAKFKKYTNNLQKELT